MCDERIYTYKHLKPLGDITEPNKYNVFISIVMAFLGEQGVLPVEYHTNVDKVAKDHI